MRLPGRLLAQRPPAPASAALVWPVCSTRSSQAAACPAASAGKLAGRPAVTEASPTPTSSSNRSPRGCEPPGCWSEDQDPRGEDARGAGVPARSRWGHTPARSSPRGEAHGSEPGDAGGSEPSAWPRASPRPHAPPAVHKRGRTGGTRGQDSAAPRDGLSGARAEGPQTPAGSRGAVRPTLPALARRATAVSTGRCTIQQGQPPALVCHHWRVLTSADAQCSHLRASRQGASGEGKRHRGTRRQMVLLRGASHAVVCCAPISSFVCRACIVIFALLGSLPKGRAPARSRLPPACAQVRLCRRVTHRERSRAHGWSASSGWWRAIPTDLPAALLHPLGDKAFPAICQNVWPHRAKRLAA